VWKVRTTKTASGKTAVQVVNREKHQTKIIKHLGSADGKENLDQLLRLADQYIFEKDNNLPLLPEVFGVDEQNRHLVMVEDLHFTNFYHHFAYEFLTAFYERNGFNKLGNNLLRDLAIIRIIDPASKLRSVDLINKYFGFSYTKNIVYKGLENLEKLKPKAQEIAVNYAQKYLNFDFSIVFYDVTTLYFETFASDPDFGEMKGLRKCGFSKENRPNQPQILIALIVNGDGYPIATNIFEGNTFEGHTFIPVILDLKRAHNIKNLTVVADAAMLSINNMEELRKQGLNYIVGARLSNLSENLLKQVSEEINRQSGKYFKTKTPLGFLVCDYSQKRADKDKSDRKKQLLKAQNQINNPARFLKRSKFIKETTASTYVLNMELIQKDELLDGIKGYYTNLENMDNQLIVDRYHDLWKIEKAFRIAKSDLLARPIFHRKRDSIEAHILIVFVSLCVAKSIELFSGFSIKKIKDLIWDVLDIKLKDDLTGKTFTKRIDAIPQRATEILERVNRQLTAY